MQEIRSHTAMRGLAALLVVFYHYRLALPESLNPDPLTQFFASGGHMVDLFFMLSGFVMALVYQPDDGRGDRVFWRRYARCRFARIYPLHLLTLVWMIALAVRGGGYTRNPELAGETLRTLLLVQGWGFQDSFALNYPSWSISGEMAAYLLFPLLLVGLLRGVIPVGSVAVLALGGLALHEYLVSLGLAWERLTLLRALPGFALGVVLCLARGRLSDLPQRGYVQIGAGLALVFLMHIGAGLPWFVPVFMLLILGTWRDRGPLPRLRPCRNARHAGSERPRLSPLRDPPARLDPSREDAGASSPDALTIS